MSLCLSRASPPQDIDDADMPKLGGGVSVTGFAFLMDPPEAFPPAYKKDFTGSFMLWEVSIFGN